MTNNNDFDDLEEIEFDQNNMKNNTSYSPNLDEPSHENRKNNDYGTTIFQELFSYIKIIVIAVIIAFICNQFIIVNAKVPTGSMEKTIMTNDRLIGFRLSYLLSNPKRLDIVIFKFPDDESENYVKRIIGLPNDIVVIKEGHVYVNDEILDEPYLKAPMNVEADATYLVPDGHYFMLGDNRNSSQDSRKWVNTYVAKDKIIAKAIFKYYNKLEFIK